MESGWMQIGLEIENASSGAAKILESGTLWHFQVKKNRSKIRRCVNLQCFELPSFILHCHTTSPPQYAQLFCTDPRTRHTLNRGTVPPCLCQWYTPVCLSAINVKYNLDWECNQLFETQNNNIAYNLLLKCLIKPYINI